MPGTDLQKQLNPEDWETLKILPEGSEQSLWLFGQRGGWLKAVMPRGSVRDCMTFQGSPTPYAGL